MTGTINSETQRKGKRKISKNLYEDIRRQIRLTRLWVWAIWYQHVLTTLVLVGNSLWLIEKRTKLKDFAFSKLLIS